MTVLLFHVEPAGGKNAIVFGKTNHYKEKIVTKLTNKLYLISGDLPNLQAAYFWYLLDLHKTFKNRLTFSSNKLCYLKVECPATLAKLQ